MRIQFCGADRTVTGSCHLLEVNGLRLLLDCGMYQGARDEADRFNRYLPDGAARVDAVILSHGHLDHCGKLPVLTKAGYAGPIYCTPATGAVARIVLADSAKIQEENVQYLNQRSRGPNDPPASDPLYRGADVAAVVQKFKPAKYGQKTDLGKGVSFTFFDAGHILGSAYIWLEWIEAGKPRTLLFTADVGRYGTPILRDPAPLPGTADVVITESTYGDASHGPIGDVEPQFLAAVQSAIDKRGRLLVPSFAVGRTQTMLWYLQKFVSQKLISPVPVYVDSPMGVQVSHIHSEFREYYDDETTRMIGQQDLFGLSQVTFASSTQQSKEINNQKGPCVIIASSPTCEFGRILHHLRQSVEQPNDSVVFVGWIPPQTLGRRLQQGDKRVRILDRWYEVRCSVGTIHGLSAHADGDELLKFLAPTLKPQATAYVVHGEVDQAEGFAGRLTSAGMGRAVVPAIDTSVVEFSAVEKKTDAPVTKSDND